MKKDWRQYKPNEIVHGNAEEHYQRKIDNVYVNVLQYTVNGKETFEMDFQLLDNSPIKDIAVNVILHTYLKEDWTKFERDAKKIIKLLV